MSPDIDLHPAEIVEEKCPRAYNLDPAYYGDDETKLDLEQFDCSQGISETTGLQCMICDGWGTIRIQGPERES